MNMIKFFKSVFAAVRDPERDFTERIFLILTFMSEVSVFIAFIGDLIIGESKAEIMILTATLIVVPAIMLICFKHNRLDIAMRIIVICLVFVIIPALFFFGGGLRGGGFVWIIFAFMYVGLLLQGKWRNIMFAFITLITIGCIAAECYHSELVYVHSFRMYYLDITISIILVGFLCFIMSWSQGYLFKEENERFKKEAERADELVRSQNRFFSSMSHEIRTPINSILGLNELILRDQNAPDDVIRDASGIQGAGKMLLALINDILDFSKIEAGSMDIVPVDYKIGDMLSEVVNMIWLRAHEKGLGFEVSVDPDVPSVLYGDEVRIKQIIVNLLNNAVKYTQKGHVGLRIESKGEDTDFVELWISISDTGMGIKKEDLPFLFDAFKRVDEGKNRHIEGTGLGLSIVKQLVDLMDGTVTVNSIYGEGSTFTVMIRQAVTDHNKVGELNIHNQQIVKRSTYESSFLAPEVRILIVDDNEMNLEVEKRLLVDTDMGIDTAKSGKEALDMALKTHYDTIFMDHLMPGMDGIECMEALRDQPGGLNRNTPVIVLTANAGSENRDMYNRAGFDGYLVKPVSGEAMEQTLIRHIPGEKLILRSVMMGDDEEIRTSDRYMDKLPVIITSSSMCDLPDALIRKLHIPIIPFVIKTDEGVFEDGVHMDANELIRHIGSGKEAVSSPPDESAYTEFFAEVLKKTHHIIHIAITTSMSEDYAAATEAAKSFDNVSVINSECLSSATGILVLIACKLVQQGLQVQDILSELEVVKKRLKCSFIINTTEYMAKKGLVSERLHKIAEALNLHPSLCVREDKKAIGGVWIGRTRRAYIRYIKKALPPDTIPDADVVFVTYVDLPEDTINWIEQEIRKTAYFEHIVFKQASAAISSNCGPGAFGILYFLKSNKSYNIASYFEDIAVKEATDRYDTESDNIEDEYEEYDAEDTSGDMPEETNDAEAALLAEMMAYVEGLSDGEESEEEPPDGPWYKKLDFIDADAALQNSGSEDALKAVMEIFYNSVPDKYAELEKFYETGDWENYTIKIHALKSSARLVGMLGLGEKAEKLEYAGKENDIQYIKDNHAQVMEEYLDIKKALDPLYVGETEASEPPGTTEGTGQASDKPLADEFLMESIYEGLKEAAEAMDSSMIEDIMAEISNYAIPESDTEKFEQIREKVSAFDYKGISDIINNN